MSRTKEQKMSRTREYEVSRTETHDVRRYVVDAEPVGRGGFGKVRQGHDVVLDRKIAVKMLDPVWATADAQDQERFRREAKTLAKLSHPNIPSIYDVVFTEDKLEIVFEFVEGTTLRDILDEVEAVSLVEAKSWFDQLGSALAHAHEKGVIHRDIKPENIIVSVDRKHCHLVDFGIALSKADVDRLTGSDEWIGTPGYMSPEQENGEEVDATDDLFVLGAVLYEALCGHKITSGDYQPLNAINELIPPAIDNLVKKCIAPKSMRPTNAEEFRNRLRTALQGHRTLSELLSGGQLHEIVDTLREMTPAQFMEMRAGQRLLILQKCQDVVADQVGRLQAARTEFVKVLTPLGIHLPNEEYRPIIEPAISMSFGIPDDSQVYHHGTFTVREALMDAAMRVESANHAVIVSSLLGFLRNVDLKLQKSSFYHALRLILQALMANQNCDDNDAPKLAEILSNVNRLQRSRTQDTERHDSEEH